MVLLIWNSTDQNSLGVTREIHMSKIWERLDWSFANTEWIKIYEDYKVKRLALIDFDHIDPYCSTRPKCQI